MDAVLQTPVSPQHPALGLGGGGSWCSLHVTDGLCAGEEAVGYKSRLDGTVLPEGGVTL